MNIALYLSYALLLGLLLIIGLELIKKKLKKQFIDSIIKIVVSILALVLLLFFLYMMANLFLASVFIVFIFFKYAFSKLLSVSTLSNYLSLTCTLLLFTYIPEKIGYWILCLLEKVKPSDIDFSDRYLTIVKALRLKILIYFVSFLLVLLSSMETFYGKTIIRYDLWVQFKPVILQSVVTVITFDRFLNLIIKEWNSIKEDISKLKDFFKPLFNNKNENAPE